MRFFEGHRQRLPHVLILAAAITTAPVPSLAGEGPHRGAVLPSLATAIEKAAAIEMQQPAPASALPTTIVIAHAVRGAVAGSAAAQQTDLGAPGFFRTPAGILTLVAIGVGVGFAVYSTSHDRVKSPAR